MENNTGLLKSRQGGEVFGVFAVGVLFSLLLFAGAVSAQEQQDFSKVQVETQKVNGNIYMLTGVGGDIAVCVGENGLLMVNSSFAPMSEKIEAALKKLSDKPVRLVVDMHWHVGDTGGNAHFEKLGAAIVAHENVRRVMISGTMRDGVKYDPFPTEALPTITYSDRATFYWSGEDIRLIHYPNADTDGGTVTYFATSHVLHTGDSFRTDGFPIVDWEHGGSVKAVIAALDNMIATYPADTKVIPGHGPQPMTVADIKPYVEMLRDARARVENALHDGKTLDQMNKDNILAGYEKYSHHVSSARFTEVLYRELAEKRQ
jgi:glyoxylase-like metal-dependent hydrolase (beta-lactamase superfamily II)